MTRILILESNSPEMVAAGVSAAQNFVEALPQVAEDLELTVAAPYQARLRAGDLAVDGVVFTGSGVEWCVDDPRGAALVDAMKQVFDAGLPVWGSCNGMQLAAFVLGGQCGASVNGREDGAALDIAVTSEGRAHPMMEGRPDRYGAPAIHRDEVTVLPDHAVLLATNGHSPVQAFAYARDGVDFWGTQYHPECRPAVIGKAMAADPARAGLAADLLVAEEDPEAAARIGFLASDLNLADRTVELRNWIAHVRSQIRGPAHAVVT